MTPELKIACEVIFQEHKASGYSIIWNKDAFRGRLSFGLSALAKETLEKKNVIYIPNPAKKTITLLNPAAAAAATFEEAEDMVRNKVPSLAASMVDDQSTYMTKHNHVRGFVNRPAKHTYQLLKFAGKSETAIAGVNAIAETKWYMKPLFFYVIWPGCAAFAGALIAYLMGFVYELIF